VGAPVVSWSLAGPVDSGQRLLGTGDRHPWQFVICHIWQMGGSGKRLWGIVPGFQILQARPTLAWGFSHFDTMSKNCLPAARWLQHNTKVLISWTVTQFFFTSLLPADPALGERLLSVPRARGICRTGMTCQKASKRLGEPIGNEQRATCVAASKGIGHIALADDR
jgi:hypothetical protein